MSTPDTSAPGSPSRPALATPEPTANLPLGIAAGLAAAIVGAAIWAAITAATEYQIGFMAIGVGFLVGFAVRTVGKGTEQIFGIAGAILALVGCALGNLLTITWFLAQQEGAPYLSVLTSLDIALAIDLMKTTFAPMDLVFYAIAAYCGFRYSLVPAGRPS